MSASHFSAVMIANSMCFLSQSVFWPIFEEIVSDISGPYQSIVIWYQMVKCNLQFLFRSPSWISVILPQIGGPHTCCCCRRVRKYDEYPLFACISHEYMYIIDNRRKHIDRVEKMTSIANFSIPYMWDLLGNLQLNFILFFLAIHLLSPISRLRSPLFPSICCGTYELARAHISYIKYAKMMHRV